MIASSYRRWLVLLVILNSLDLMVTGCEDSSDTVGFEAVDRGGSTGVLHTDTLYVSNISHHLSFVDSFATAAADRLYLGSVNEAGAQYDFRIVMRFVIDDHNLDSATVTRARIRMISSGSYGTGGSFTANIHSIQKNWGSPDILWDRFIQNVDYGPAYTSSTVSNLPASGSSVVLGLPRDTAQYWINALTDTSTVNPPIQRGILIDFSGATFIQQFYGGHTLTLSATTLDTSRVPRLEIDYQKIEKNGDITVATVFVAPATIARIGYNGGTSGYLYRDNAPQPADQIIVGGGLPYHSLLRFNTSKLDKSLTINRATLVMPVDPSGNYRRAPGDSIIIEGIRMTTDTNSWKPGGIGFDNFAPRNSDQISDDTLRLNISSLLQGWAAAPSENFGVMLLNRGEVQISDFQTALFFNRLYRMRFKYNSADPENSPKIFIQYTLPPK